MRKKKGENNKGDGEENEIRLWPVEIDGFDSACSNHGCERVRFSRGNENGDEECEREEGNSNLRDWDLSGECECFWWIGGEEWAFCSSVS